MDIVGEAMLELVGGGWGVGGVGGGDCTYIVISCVAFNTRGDGEDNR